MKQGFFTRIEIHLTRWSIIILAISGIFYIALHASELLKPAKSVSVRTQATSEPAFQKKSDSEPQNQTGITSAISNNTTHDPARDVPLVTEQPGNLIDPEFSIVPFENVRGRGLRLCVINKNPFSTSTLGAGDDFKITFSPEHGQVRLIPSSIAVKSFILSPDDFQAAAYSNQVHLVYAGNDKKFDPWDSCCVEISLHNFDDSKALNVQFSSSGVAIANKKPVHVVLHSSMISRYISSQQTINLEDDYKTYIGSYSPAKPIRKTPLNYNKPKREAIQSGAYHKKNAKPHTRNASRKTVKHKKKTQKRAA